MTFKQGTYSAIPTLDEMKAMYASEHYEADVLCLNCGFKGRITVPKGKLVKGQECPNCGVRFCDSAEA